MGNPKFYLGSLLWQKMRESVSTLEQIHNMVYSHFNGIEMVEDPNICLAMWRSEDVDPETEQQFAIWIAPMVVTS